jgi:hypothetical protein
MPGPEGIASETRVTMNLNSRPILIIGMQRSGTSALAGALARLGLSLGNEKWLYEADINNPTGYFENRKITTLNMRCLDIFQMHATSFNGLQPNWKEHPMAGDLRSDLKNILEEEFEGVGRWGIKHPLNSLLLPLYNDVFSEMGLEPSYILCVRNPLEPMASEARLDFGDSYRVMASLGKMAIGSWLRYTLGSFADTHGHSLQVVSYDELLVNPRLQLERVVSHEQDWTPTEDEWQAAAASVKPDLRHNRGAEDAFVSLPSLVRETYRAAISFDGGDSCWKEVLGLHRKFEEWVHLMAEPGPQAGKLGLSWVEGGVRKVAEARFAPSGGWQTVCLEIDAPPRTWLVGLIYGQPCRVWIRRSEWHFGDQASPAPLACGSGSEITTQGDYCRLNGVFEPDQIRFRTTDAPGPYRLELEFWLETGLSISGDAAYRVSRRLDQCVTVVEEMLCSKKPGR